MSDVSIHATLAGGDVTQRLIFFVSHPVSIHATLAGGDSEGSFSPLSPQVFLSTPPSRVATPSAPATAIIMPVSIHATLAGGDVPRGLVELR